MSLSKLVSRARNWLSYGGLRFHCPLCSGRFRKMFSFGNPPRLHAQCPRCGSLERHRLIFLFLRGETDLFKNRPKRLLHTAPEPCLVRILEKVPGLDYVTADLLSPLAKVKMDLTHILEPSASYDAILCVHVMEHIPDDHAALGELYRVLKPGGWALIQVPMRGEVTFEDWSITDEAGRTAAFGQADHVRWCGRDYIDRIRRAGFHVVVKDDGYLSAGTRKRLHVSGESFFFCQKPSGAETPGQDPAVA